MANAAFLSLATQASISLVNNKGNLGKTFKELGRSSTVKNLATAVITAGVADKIGATSTLNSTSNTEWVNNLSVNLANAGSSAVIAGSFFGGDPRIVKINGRRVEAKPEGTLLLLENLDRPGMIGAYGTILGKHKVNIANMSLARNEEGGTALTLLTLDSTPGDDVLSDLKKIEGVKNIHCVVVE